MATWKQQLEASAVYKASVKQPKLTTAQFYVLVTRAIADLEQRIIALGG